MEHSPRWVTPWTTDQVLVNFKKLKLFQEFSLITMLRLEINYKNKTAKNTNSWKLNNILLNNQWIIKEIKEEIKRYLKTNDNEDATIQNLRYTAKAVLRVKILAIQSHHRKEEKTQINILTLHLKQLEKGQNPKLVE